MLDLPIEDDLPPLHEDSVQEGTEIENEIGTVREIGGSTLPLVAPTRHDTPLAPGHGAIGMGTVTVIEDALGLVENCEYDLLIPSKLDVNINYQAFFLVLLVHREGRRTPFQRSNNPFLFRFRPYHSANPPNIHQKQHSA